jgi:hypothetical protein
LAGIGIYLNEYKKHLADRAAFFVPENIENLIYKHGNKQLYDKQKDNFDLQAVKDENLVCLIKIIHKYENGLEQEVLI